MDVNEDVDRVQTKQMTKQEPSINTNNEFQFKIQINGV